MDSAHHHDYNDYDYNDYDDNVNNSCAEIGANRELEKSSDSKSCCCLWQDDCPRWRHGDRGGVFIGKDNLSGHWRHGEGY